MKKLLVTYSFALIALIFSLTGCGKPKTLSQAVDCTGSTTDAQLKYSVSVYSDGTADSSCSVNGKQMVAYFNDPADADRYQRHCSVNLENLSYWRFTFDLKNANAALSNGQTAVMTCVPKN